VGANEVVWLAIAGAAVACVAALACAVAAAWMARQDRATPQPVRVPVLHAPVPSQPAPMPMPTIVVQVPTPVAAPHAPFAPPSADTAGPVVLQGRYPQLGRALGAWLQTEPDPIERTRIARDLGSLGSGDAARSLLDGVRTGVLSPTVAADHLARGGFEAGIAVAAALRDPEPRVRALAGSIVARTTPVEAIEAPRPARPMPPVPGPGADPRQRPDGGS
jgi:hypothetical protein